MLYRKAFSLVELLVVITIIAILSAAAIPSYNKYIVKTQVSNVLAIANAYKLKFLEEILHGNLEQQVYDLNDKIVSSILVGTSETEPVKYLIHVIAKMKTIDHNGIGLRQLPNTKYPLLLQLQGSTVGELITWECHAPKEYHEYVPVNCRHNDLVELNVT